MIPLRFLTPRQLLPNTPLHPMAAGSPSCNRLVVAW
jgi:hypothetical protein